MHRKKNQKKQRDAFSDDKIREEDEKEPKGPRSPTDSNQES